MVWKILVLCFFYILILNYRYKECVGILYNNGYDNLKELEFLKKTGTLVTVLDRMKNSNDADFIDLE